MTAAPQLVRAGDVAPQPWRNGLGRTRELLAWPDAADWRVRISVAEVEADAPFSAYPGVSRWFVVLKGAGVELRAGDAVHRLTRTDAPVHFDGGVAATCRPLDGPTLDLNLMLRGGRGAMRVIEDGAHWKPGAAWCGMFSAVAGCCLAGDREFELPPYALLWFESVPPALRFVAGQRPAGAVGWWLSA